MIAVDSSVAIAAFGSWHLSHHAALAVLEEGPALPAHAMLETYSVLTGFPPPHRAPPDLVVTWLQDSFRRVLAAPPPAAHRDLLRSLGDGRRTGGAVYDGLVALTAARAGAVLVTADVRAAPVYELVGVAVRRIDEP